MATKRVLVWLVAGSFVAGSCGGEIRLGAADYVASVEQVCGRWKVDRKALDAEVEELESRTQQDLAEFSRQATARAFTARDEMLAVRGPGDLEAVVQRLWAQTEANQAELVELLTSQSTQEENAGARRDELQAKGRDIFEEFIAAGFDGCRELNR